MRNWNARPSTACSCVLSWSSFLDFDVRNWSKADTTLPLEIDCPPGDGLDFGQMASTLRLLTLLLLACVFAAPARADSWAAPTVTEVFSASRDHFVRITPGESLGDTSASPDRPRGPMPPPNITRGSPTVRTG